MGALISIGPQLLVVVLLSIAAIITAVMRFKIVDRALEGTKPNERPGIIRELRGLWKSDWQLGPLGRIKPSERARQNDEGGTASTRKIYDADEDSEPPTLDR